MPPRSKKHSDAARRNGALSRGPVSPQGKAISSRNALSHGLTANSPIFSPAEQELFDRFTEIFIRHFQPADDFELLLVQDAARAQWLRRRADILHARLIDLETDLLSPQFAESLESPSHVTCLALAYKSLADNSSSLSSLDRHGRRHGRDFFKTLDQLERQAQNRPVQNEPIEAQPASSQQLPEDPSCSKTES